MSIAKVHSCFTTITCLEWKHLLLEDCNKDIIVDSLRFLSCEKRAVIYAFVIMKNHFHVIWQMMRDHERDKVQRDFLKFTAQMILKRYRNIISPFMEDLLVDAKDRK